MLGLPFSFLISTSWVPLASCGRRTGSCHPPASIPFPGAPGLSGGLRRRTCFGGGPEGERASLCFWGRTQGLRI